MSDELVLVVDDDPDIRDIVELLLTEILDLDVCLAADGESALVLARRLHPALVLLDVDLPDLSGLEVARRLKANAATRDVPLIALTGRERGEVVQAGFDGYVGKPFRPERLLTEVSGLLGTHAHSMLTAAA